MFIVFVIILIPSVAAAGGIGISHTFSGTGSASFSSITLRRFLFTPLFWDLPCRLIQLHHAFAHFHKPPCPQFLQNSCICGKCHQVRILNVSHQNFFSPDSIMRQIFIFCCLKSGDKLGRKQRQYPLFNLTCICFENKFDTGNPVIPRLGKCRIKSEILQKNRLVTVNRNPKKLKFWYSDAIEAYFNSEFIVAASVSLRSTSETARMFLKVSKQFAVHATI